MRLRVAAIAVIASVVLTSCGGIGPEDRASNRIGFPGKCLGDTVYYTLTGEGSEDTPWPRKAEHNAWSGVPGEEYRIDIRNSADGPIIHDTTLVWQEEYEPCEPMYGGGPSECWPVLQVKCP